MKTTGCLESLLARTHPPAAPVSLKTRVIAAARSAYREPRPSLTDRLWSNRQLRLAWGLAVVVLVTVNLYLAGSPTPAASEKASPPSSLAWRFINAEDQLQPATRQRRPSGSSLQEIEELLLGGLPNSQTAGGKAEAQEG